MAPQVRKASSDASSLHVLILCVRLELLILYRDANGM